VPVTQDPPPVFSPLAPTGILAPHPIHRSHRHFLATVRHLLSLALGIAAARPRNREGVVRYEEKSLIEEHKAQAIYAALAV
jgi:hypothetical protein